MSDQRLDGRAAIVTGAGRGLGEAIAAELAARGARVLLADIDADAAARAAEEIAAQVSGLRDPKGAPRPEGPGPIAESAALDVADWDAFGALVADFHARAGRLDILVNNAARSVARSFWEIEPEEWDEVMAVNLRSVVAGCRAAGPIMRAAGWGRIVNLGSLAGQQGGVANGAHYAASKAGIGVVTKIVAGDLAGSGVTVNAVAPAAIEGPVMDALPAERQAAIAAQIPVGRAGRPEEVAATVAFLASEEAAFITGATIDVNGGLHMR
jgi:3-oxoacyl-[acyl-carrier protein] reductase